MANKRYRSVIKVYCSNCKNAAINRKYIDIRCKSCSYLRYNNVNNLTSMLAFLDTKHSDWVYWNVYEYVKDANGKHLKSYKNYNKDGIRDVPVSPYEL